MDANYYLLSGAKQSSRGLFGSMERYPLPFLLRHGGLEAMGEGFVPFRHKEIEQYVRAGRCRFWLSGIGHDGRPLDLTKTLFFPDRPFGTVLLGAQLAAEFRQHCSLQGACLVPLPPGQTRFHAWPYTVLPDGRCEMSLYDELATTLGGEPLDWDAMILKELCASHSMTHDEGMHLLVPPYLHPEKNIRLDWHESRIRLEAHDVVVRCASGETPLTRRYLQRGEVVACEGLLFPEILLPAIQNGCADCLSSGMNRVVPIEFGDFE